MHDMVMFKCVYNCIKFYEFIKVHVYSSIKIQKNDVFCSDLEYNAILDGRMLNKKKIRYKNSKKKITHKIKNP